MNITISGKEIELNERPKHKAVMQVQNIMTEWLMENIDLSNLAPSTSIEEALQQSLVSNPALAVSVNQMQQTLQIDQTIMLATGFSYKELNALKDEVFEDEYQQLYEGACKALGGNASDFFGAYSSGSFLNPKTKNRENFESETSTNQQVTSSETSTEPYEVKMSTSQD
jgi:hypothetical protein